MRPPSKFPARHAIPVGIPRPATSTPFAFSARRNGSAVTEIMRPASPILIRHNPGDCFVIPRVLLVLTGPSGPSVPQGPVAGKVSGAGWNDPGQDRSGLWLRNAAAGLCVLAAAAAAVSFTAQYRMAETARHLPAIAALEAAIPDAAALVFACLGIALALHGRRALRARTLNLASVAASVFMNVIAAAPGWRNLAIWAMPPVAYALASDTLIGVSLGLVILKVSCFCWSDGIWWL